MMEMEDVAIEIKQEPAEVSVAEATPNVSGTPVGNVLIAQAAAHDHCYSGHQLSIGKLPWKSEESTNTKQYMEPALMRANQESPRTCCPHCGNSAYLLSSYEKKCHSKV